MPSKKKTFRIITERALPNFHVIKDNKFKNFLYLNGLQQSPDLYLRNPAIEHFICNSAHTAEVLEALSLNLSFAHQNDEAPTLAPISIVEPFLPCIASKTGYDSIGKSLEFPFQTGSKKLILGHSLRARKNDSLILVGIVLQMAKLAKQNGLYLKFCVAQQDMDGLTKVANSIGELALFKKTFAAMPHLKNSELMKLFRMADFGLAYNSDWESFGFYSLESVFYGCPIFTNGSGNLRHLLPKNSGIQVRDSADFYFGTQDSRLLAIKESAVKIWNDLKKVKAQCRTGKKIIERRYSFQNFSRKLNLTLNPRDPKKKSVRKRVGLAPWVRIFEPKTGRLVSDYQSLVLPRQFVEIVIYVQRYKRFP
ncbi:MAG: hypothetical protein K2X47_07605, partial [Bdellovibrionales bacterium]|nr:hypothetical protein [Bdellovibrionales bacterium]